jgi:hypothetical protein
MSFKGLKSNPGHCLRTYRSLTEELPSHITDSSTNPLYLRIWYVGCQYRRLLPAYEWLSSRPRDVSEAGVEHDLGIFPYLPGDRRRLMGGDSGRAPGLLNAYYNRQHADTQVMMGAEH